MPTFSVIRKKHTARGSYPSQQRIVLDSAKVPQLDQSEIFAITNWKMMKNGGYTGDAEEASSAWEKCSRTILLNSKVEILDLLELLQKLCMNIISNADDLKYRTIKLNNKTIQSRLLSRKGGLEFLSAIGFRTVIIDGVKNLQLDIGDADRTLKFDEIEDSLSWLISTVNTCVHIAEASLRYSLIRISMMIDTGF